MLAALLYPYRAVDLHCFAELMAPASPPDAAHPREGRFVIGDESHPLLLRRLPCVVESFKTYDDINLVKTADVGEVAPAQRFVQSAHPPARLHMNHLAAFSKGNSVLVPAQRHAKAVLSDALHLLCLRGCCTLRTVWDRRRILCGLCCRCCWCKGRGKRWRRVRRRATA